MDKILYFGNFNCKKGFAAVNRAIGNAILFNRLGFEVTIYSRDITDSILNSQFFHDKNVIFSSKPYSGISSYYRYKFFINELKRQSDVRAVVLYNMPSIPFAKILRYCKKNGIKVIADVTEWYDVKNINLFFKLIRSIDTHWRMTSLHLKVDAMIVISNFLQQYYKSKYSGPIYKIYPIMDFARFGYNKLPQLNDATSRFTLGYIGMNRKGKDEINNIIPFICSDHNKTFNVHYIGTVDDNILKKYSSNNNISFLGVISHDDVVNQYNKIDMSLIIRKSTRANNAGFPTKFAESICFGTPVICNSFSDLEEIIKKYQCGILIEDIIDLQDISLNDLSLKSFSTDLASKLFIADYYFDVVKNMLEKIGLIK